MSKPIRVVIIEDHALTRAGLRAFLTAAGVEVVGEAADGISALELIERMQPSVAIVDVGLPGRDGLELTRAIKVSMPQVGVVILTMADFDRNVYAALRAGADAYCVKASDPAVLLEAVTAVSRGGAYFDPQIASVALGLLNGRKNEEQVLSQRELEILQLIANGQSNAEIAAQLFLGLGTVKGYIAEILEKLSASDRTQAAVTAFKRGLL